MFGNNGEKFIMSCVELKRFNKHLSNFNSVFVFVFWGGLSLPCNSHNDIMIKLVGLLQKKLDNSVAHHYGNLKVQN